MTREPGEAAVDEQPDGAPRQPGWSLRPATAQDASWLADLKAEAMRADLQRLGYWDRDWARQRFLDAYVPANTSIIVLPRDQVAGCIAVRSEPDAWWIEHFYLHAQTQGRGLGGQVLRHVITKHDDGRPFRLALDRGSRVRALYERHGFTHVSDDDNDVDQILQRPAAYACPAGSALTPPHSYRAGFSALSRRIERASVRTPTAHPWNRAGAATRRPGTSILGPGWRRCVTGVAAPGGQGVGERGEGGQRHQHAPRVADTGSSEPALTPDVHGDGSSADGTDGDGGAGRAAPSEAGVVRCLGGRGGGRARAKVVDLIAMNIAHCGDHWSIAAAADAGPAVTR